MKRTAGVSFTPDALEGAGFSPTAVDRIRGALRSVVAHAAEPHKAKPFFVPGRIEVLGKHTDYAGGRSLVCGIERGFSGVAVPDGSNVFSVTDASTGESVSLLVEGGTAPPRGHWSVYPATVLRRLTQDFGPLVGGQMVFLSDLPSAAGVSSSSAFVVATFLALDLLNEVTKRSAFAESVQTREQLADYLGCVENGRPYGKLEGERGVGTLGGSQDQAAIVCAEAGRCTEYTFRPVYKEGVVALPNGYTMVIGASGVTAAKTGAALDLYNRAARRANAVEALWQEATDMRLPLGAAVRGDGFDPENMRKILRSVSHPEFSADSLLRRFLQFYRECEEIIPGAVDALAAGDLNRFGLLVDTSQELAEACLENQIPETMLLARTAREIGAVAASAFGAGFGGSVWAMVPTVAADAFAAKWRQAYCEAFPNRKRAASFFAVNAGPGALCLDRNALNP